MVHNVNNLRQGLTVVKMAVPPLDFTHLNVTAKPSLPPQVAALQATIVIEHCTDCHKHAYCTRHDEEKYKAKFREVYQALLSAFPNIDVQQNPSAFLRKQNGCCTPRIGSFEIYVCNLRENRVNIIFSKMATHRWPYLEDLPELVAAALAEPTTKRTGQRVPRALSARPAAKTARSQAPSRRLVSARPSRKQEPAAVRKEPTEAKFIPPRFLDSQASRPQYTQANHGLQKPDGARQRDVLQATLQEDKGAPYSIPILTELFPRDGKRLEAEDSEPAIVVGLLQTPVR